MSVSRVHTWIAGEVLTASDLNAEFNNIVNAGASLISPLTAALNFGGFQATNLRLETQSATQSAAAEGVIYWHTGEDALHISTGSAQARVPALTAIQTGELVGIYNASGVEGATSFARFQLGTGLSLSGTVLSSTATATAYPGHSRVHGLVGNTTTTTIVVNCDAVVLVDSSGVTVRHTNPGDITLDSAASGLDGRDQAGAFSSGQTLYVYYISNGTTLHTVLSDAGPTTGPDLTTLAAFSGYTYTAFIGEHHWNGSSNFIPARLRGCWVNYETLQNVLSTGTQTVETTFSLSGIVPGGSLMVKYSFLINATGGSAAGTYAAFRVISGSDAQRVYNNAAGTNAKNNSFGLHPYVSATPMYLLSASTAPEFSVDVLGYSVKNGDS